MDRIKVYIYTAVNGYAWQGCDEDLAAALQKCVGQLGESEAGGIRRWEIGGFNGTAIYRCHVRKGGDFQGRDSKYVALAFLPFGCVGERRVDFAAIWNHPYLAAPLARSESLEGLEIGLESVWQREDGMEGDAVAGPYWTSPKTITDGMAGGEEDILKRLSELFQSRKTELGSLSARIERLDGGEVATQPKYTPFQSVVDETSARNAFEVAVARKATEGEKTAAFMAWQEAVETLAANADPSSGRFRHFLGFVAFARAEREALDESRDGDAATGESSAALKKAEKLLDIVERKLDGEESALLDWARGAIDEQRQRLLRAAGPVDGEIDRCNALARRIGTIRDESAKVAAWVEGVRNGDVGSARPPRPSHIAQTLALLADSLDEERSNARRLSKENATANATIKDLNLRIEQLEKAKSKSRPQKAKPVEPAAPAVDDEYKKYLDQTSSQDRTSGRGHGDEPPPRSRAILSVVQETLLWIAMSAILIATVVVLYFFIGKGGNPLRHFFGEGETEAIEKPVVNEDNPEPPPVGDVSIITNCLNDIPLKIKYHDWPNARRELDEVDAELAEAPEGEFAEERAKAKEYRAIIDAEERNDAEERKGKSARDDKGAAATGGQADETEKKRPPEEESQKKQKEKATPQPPATPEPSASDGPQEGPKEEAMPLPQPPASSEPSVSDGPQEGPKDGATPQPPATPEPSASDGAQEGPKDGATPKPPAPSEPSASDGAQEAPNRKGGH